MKRTLIASAAFASLLTATNAFAADLPVKAPVVVAVVYDWTGFYIGTNVGYSWGRGSTDGTATGIQTVTSLVAATTVTPVSGLLSGRADVNGFIGGGQFGYNWQRGAWLFGLEGDIQFSNERQSGDVVCTLGVTACPTFTRDYKLDWFGTARGRVGFLPAERILLYATGGLAYGNFSGSSLGVPGTTPNALAFGAWSFLRAGWTVGGGVEAALGGNWSIKFEYLYMDLGNVGGTTATNITTVNGRTTTALTYVFNTRFTDNIARVGLNYKFGGPDAVVAKY
jgi:outer membrane immunogenic protein